MSEMADILPFSSNPKIAETPVQFPGSDDAAGENPAAPPTVSEAAVRESAAIAIQKALRGFLVRKNVNLIHRTTVEADEIERAIREEEANIRMDVKAQIRVSEELIALLLRLDYVRWVRDLRKKIIRRVMGLLEAVDSISAAADQTMPVIELEIESPAAVESPAGKIDLIAAATNGGIPNSVITENHEESMKSSSIDNLNAGDQSDDPELGMEIENRSPEIQISTAKDSSEGGKGLKEMMERMAVENESVKMMVARLCETSAEQCWIIDGLAGRIGKLEHVVRRMARRKKWRGGAAPS